MPARNAAPYVQQALQSILDQSGVDLEAVVVDDGSTDGTAQRALELNDPRVRIVPGPGAGIAAAFNAGLEAARGAYAARCDADDEYPPGRLAWQRDWLDEHREFGAVCGYFAAVDDRGRHLSNLALKPAAREITADLRAGEAQTHYCTFLARTDLLKALGGCRPYFVTAEDLDLQLRLGDKTRVWYEPRLCYVYRLHGTSATHVQADALRLFYESMAREFSRQRQSEGSDALDRQEAPAPPDAAAAGGSRLLGEQVQGFLTSRAWNACRNGRRAEALSLGWRACWARPQRAEAWTSLVKLGVRCLWPRTPHRNLEPFRLRPVPDGARRSPGGLEQS
jgi:GT2 family glycosyltransferase